jgi:hypothetical protein
MDTHNPSPHRPGVYRIGKVTHSGTTTIIAGWGLALCARQCQCHQHPDTGSIVIMADDALGLLGLISFDSHCRCCAPWTADELEAMVRDLAELEQMPTQETS